MNNDLNSFITNHFKGKNKYEKFGYEKVGPFLYAFIIWLHQQVKNDEISQVVFLSRDGYLMRKAYTLINDEKEKTFYFYCSRKSLRSALIWNSHTYNDAIRYINKNRIITVSHVLEYFGFDEKKQNILAKQENIDLSRKIKYSEIKNDLQLEKIYYSYRNEINTWSKEQDKLLFKYFLTLDIKNTFGLVDVGWHGSMQFYLEEFFLNHNLDICINGYYLGIQSFYSLKGISRGFLFEEGNYRLRASILSFFGVEEKILQSREGSTLAYEQNNCGSVIPILAEYEYKDDNDIITIIKSIQNSSLKFIIDARENKLLFPREVCIKPLVGFGTNPTLKEVKMFDFFYNNDGGVYYFTARKSIFCYRPKEFYEALLYSPWKTGFLKSAIKIPFPYFLIYKMVV